MKDSALIKPRRLPLPRGFFTARAQSKMNIYQTKNAAYPLGFDGTGESVPSCGALDKTCLADILFPTPIPPGHLSLQGHQNR